jgi:hypothetical protein
MMKPVIKIIALLSIAVISISTGCKKNTVTSKVNIPTSAILSFALDSGQAIPSIITNSPDSATVVVYAYPWLNLFQRMPHITASKGATISPAAGTPVNFTTTGSYTYTVTNPAGVSQKWYVIIKVYGQNRPPSTVVYKDTSVTSFFRRTSGHIASDGGYSIPLSSGMDLWMMGDSHINDYRASDGTMDWLFQVHNAGLLQPANDWMWQHTETLVGTVGSIPSYIKFTDDNTHWIWPNSGFQVGDTLFEYSSNLITVGSGTFGFGPAGNDLLAKIHVPDMRVSGVVQLQNFNGINFGITFIKNTDGYIYTYGNKSAFIASNLYLARFPANNIYAPWTFYDGSGWNADVTKAAVIGQGQSNGVSINYVNGKFLIVSTEFSVSCNGGNRIYISTSDSPVGPFTAARPIYRITDTVQNDYPFFYAAIIHPEYTNAQGEVLVTYAINGYPGCLPAYNADYRSIPDWYRLRGIRIPWSVITSNYQIK